MKRNLIDDVECGINLESVLWFSAIDVLAIDDVEFGFNLESVLWFSAIDVLTYTKCGFATSMRWDILCIVIPKTSVISKSLVWIPRGSSQSPNQSCGEVEPELAQWLLFRGDSGATSLTSPKRYELKILPLEINIAIHESLWFKCFWIFATLQVSPCCPCIHEEPCFGRNIVPVSGYDFHGFSWD